MELRNKPLNLPQEKILLTKTIKLVRLGSSEFLSQCYSVFGSLSGHALCIDRRTCLVLSVIPAHSFELAEQDCSHSQCQPPEVPPPTPCCSDNCNGHPRDTDKLPNIIVQRSNNEPLIFFTATSIIFDSNVSVECQQHPLDFRNTLTFNSSAPACFMRCCGFDVLL